MKKTQGRNNLANNLVYPQVLTTCGFFLYICDMSDNTKKTILYIVAALAILAAGFFIGRSFIKTKTVTFVKYEKSDPIIIKKDSLVPFYVHKPVDTTNVILEAIKSGRFTDLFPTRDSLIYVTKDDSSAVIRDWATERWYRETLFDIDTVGTEIVDFKVQYNRLQMINGVFTPVAKTVNTTETIVKKYSPCVGGGITTAPEFVVTAGMFFEDKYGFSFIYEYDWVLKRHVGGMTALYKF